MVNPAKHRSQHMTICTIFPQDLWELAFEAVCTIHGPDFQERLLQLGQRRALL
jgi:hypothetical protein